MIRVTDLIAIPDEELEWSYARSGGPGGQNVNKVSSKAVLRWSLFATTALPADVKSRLLGALKTTNDGEIVISCDETRDQAQNVSIAEERLANLIRANMTPPKPRKKTKPSRGAKERRLKEKTVRGEIKRGRGGRFDD